MKLVVGLGNPGARYAFTRHNAGFMAVDVYLSRFGQRKMGKQYGSWFLQASPSGVDTSFLKPGSFMNLSGGPVRQAMDDLGLEPSDLLVLHDDIDIKFGEARYKIGGGHGGHNGLRSIMESIGGADFHRIRLGVGRPPEGMAASDYVLSAFSTEEEDGFLDGLESAFDLLESRFLFKA
ncbi:MAG: aminoacyl-tRNA hydrolase [Nitrospinota bacterium]|nr:aminoacyl-tRNA hydrolase [Nitrospinota bacterium]MDH5678609.1 aminoacyl-tRNA hydrolase [Nitrospinota bacterium]MDH5755188.1 aminoacyl-tRNA hydrolase [Nitrospinota bacterium]